MTVYEDLLLEEVLEDDDKVVLMFVDQDKNEVHDVVWRKKVFDKKTKKFVDDPNKLKQVEEWSVQFLGVPLFDIKSAEGSTHTVYSYDTYEALWEADKKFDSDMVGQIINSKIKSVDSTDEGIIIRFDYDGGTYRSNMKFTELRNGTYYIKPQKRNRRLKEFEDKFGVPLERANEIVGKDILVEVKAMGPNTYSEIKPFPKKK